MKPYVGFPLTGACPLKCSYCAPEAEASGSSKRWTDLESLRKWVEVALSEGISKFRLTGGEPLLHPEIGKILAFFSHLPATTTLNTAAFLIEKKREIFDGLGPHLKIICSLDTLQAKRFDNITQTKGFFEPTLTGIRIVSEKGLLKRLNMMVIAENKDEIFPLIDFCSELKCDLKLSDIAQAPEQFGAWGIHHVDLGEIEPSLSLVSTNMIRHRYSETYGIPCKIYEIKGVWVTVKAARHGTTYYLRGHCRSCPHFPCEEGHYFINSRPDASLSACRMNGFTIDKSDYRSGLRDMIKMFANTERFTKE